MNGKLSSLRAEQITPDADVVAPVEQLVESKTFSAHEIELYVDLELLPALLQMSESRLALEADGDDAPRHFYLDARVLQLLGGLVGVLCENLRRRMGEIEFVRIRLLPQGLDLPELLLAPLIYVLLE